LAPLKEENLSDHRGKKGGNTTKTKEGIEKREGRPLLLGSRFESETEL